MGGRGMKKRRGAMNIAKLAAAASLAVVLSSCPPPFESELVKAARETVEGEQPRAPLAPSDLEATAVSASQIDLTWTDNSDNEQEFQIQKKKASSENWQTDTVGADSTAYSDQGLSDYTEYTYRVRAANSAGESAWTQEVNATTDDPTAPSVEISSTAGTVTASVPIPFMVVFSEPVSGFDQNDLDISVDIGDFSVSGFSSNTAGDEYTFDVSPDTDPATVTVDVPAGAAEDEAGNPNTAADQPFGVLYDTSELTVSITSGITSPTNSSPVSLTIEFSEEVNDFILTDIVIGNGWSVANFNGSSNPTFFVDIEAGNKGLVTVNIPAAAATAVATGRDNQAAQQYEFTYDTTPPGAPDVGGDSSPTADRTPQWTWSGGGGGNGTYRYKLNDSDLTSGATTTTNTSFIPGSELNNATHTLYVQERDDAGNWSASGSFDIIVSSYSVTYAGRGNEGGTVPTDNSYYLPGDEVTVKSGAGLYQDDTTDRYFVYWNTQPDGSGNIYVPGGAPHYNESFTMGSSDVFLYAIYIGDRGPANGWLFYDKGSYSDGWRFMEAAESDLIYQYVWSNVDNQELEWTNTGIGTGKDNTLYIIGQDGHTNSAAQACLDYAPPGFSDWFLPSKDELNLMYTNLQDQNPAIGGFSSDYYWSSSEVEYSSDWAWPQRFSDGGQVYDGKSNHNCVRAVRDF
jgi:hypothetical protein